MFLMSEGPGLDFLDPTYQWWVREEHQVASDSTTDSMAELCFKGKAMPS